MIALSILESDLAERLQAFADGPFSANDQDAEVLLRIAKELALKGLSPGPAVPGRGGSGSSFVLTNTPALFSYQQQLVDKLDSTLGGLTRTALVSLPTGGGKTRTGLWFFREQAARKLRQRLLWMAPSEELVAQAVTTAEDLWRRFSGAPDVHASIGRIPGVSTRGRQNDCFAAFVTAQKAANRITEIARYEPDLVVFDEAHQATARTFRATLKAVPDSTWVIGLSATPGRSEDTSSEDLFHLFDGNLVTATELGNRPVDALIQRGVLARLVFRSIPLPRQWEPVRVRSLSGRNLSLDELALNRARFWASVDLVAELARDPGSLVFAASIAHCYALAAALRARGVEADAISHTTSSRRREGLIASFKSGDLPVLINKSILATGFDCPGVRNVILATPIRSPILWEQIVGRAARGPAVGGTAEGSVWELDDHRAMHRNVLSYERFAGSLW